MKVKNIIYSAMIVLILASCNKEEDHYESKDVKVDSVFDKTDEVNDNNGEDKQEDNQENKEDNNQNQEENEEEKKDNEENNPDSNNSDPENQDKKKYRATNSVNLRTEPNTNADNVILAIDTGKEFESIEELEANGQSWVKLEYEGKTGYVIKDLLEEVNN